MLAGLHAGQVGIEMTGELEKRRPRPRTVACRGQATPALIFGNIIHRYFQLHDLCAHTNSR